jgi:hypothetical protein
MDVTTPCDLCASRLSTYTCKLCGKRICDNCVTVQGYCKQCAGTTNIELDEKLVNKVLESKGMDKRILK